MMKFKWIFAVFFLTCLLFTAQAQTDTILNRYREYLVRTGPLPAEEGGGWEKELTIEGQWPDIDYKDQIPAGWKIARHLKRVREMALAWASPQSSYYHDPRLWQKINVALDHWLEKRYQSTNWWHNEIGIPRTMRDVIVLLRHDLPAARLQQALAVMGQLRVHEDYVGGNLIWGADLGLHYGALTGDQALVDRCRQLILKEIQITTSEGIQPDFSFHQHGKRLQLYQYGKAFLFESLRVAWQLRGTPLAFPEEKVNILTGFITEGWQWMARGIHTVPGTMDRSSSRKGELKAADLRPLIPFMMELQPEKVTLFQNIEAIQNAKHSLAGYRYYPYSDFVAYQRPGFSFFLKTISARTYATESINRENLKGKLLNSGDAYLIRNGQEYFNLMPVWDWTALPGITMFEGAHQAVRQSFVGSVSDETCGFTAMDYRLKDQSGKQELSARKFWACHQDLVVCLVADLKWTNLQSHPYTALDQCRWQGDVTVNKVGNVVKGAQHKLHHVKWIHHAGFAYIPLKPATMQLHLNKVAGTWSSVNASETGDTVMEKMFMPVLVHNQGQNASGGYVLALSKTPRQARSISRRSGWKVLQNDSSCQAVLFNDGTLMAAFYTPGKIDTGKGLQVQSDQPCLVLIKDGKVSASDPSHKGMTVRLKLNKDILEIVLPKDGFSASRPFLYR